MSSIWLNWRSQCSWPLRTAKYCHTETPLYLEVLEVKGSRVDPASKGQIFQQRWWILLAASFRFQNHKNVNASSQPSRVSWNPENCASLKKLISGFSPRTYLRRPQQIEYSIWGGYCCPSFFEFPRQTCTATGLVHLAGTAEYVEGSQVGGTLFSCE